MPLTSTKMLEENAEAIPPSLLIPTEKNGVVVHKRQGGVAGGGGCQTTLRVTRNPAPALSM